MKTCNVRNTYGIWILVLIILASALGGCGDGAEADGGQAGKESRKAGEEGAPGRAGTEGSGKEEADPGKAESSLWFLTGAYGESSCGTEEGYYYLTEDIEELADGLCGIHLMYMDYASLREVFLCSTAGCRHDTRDCPAVFPCDEFTPSAAKLFMYKDSLYILSREYDDDGSMQTNMTAPEEGEVQAETKAAALYLANPDGTGREKIYTFDQALTLEDVVIGGERGIYVITKRLSSDSEDNVTYITSQERKLQCFRPETGELEEVCSMDFEDGISWKIAGCGSGGSLILRGTDYGRELSREETWDEDAYRELYEASSDVYAELTLEGGALREFYRVPNEKEYSGRIVGESLDLSFAGNPEIVSVRISDGKEETLCSIPQNLIMGNLGEVLCLRDWDLTGDQTWYFVNTATGETGHNPLVNRNNGWSLEFKAETASDVLMVYDYDAEKNGDGSYTIRQYHHGLISKEDLFSGKETYREIEMIGKGQ